MLKLNKIIAAEEINSKLNKNVCKVYHGTNQKFSEINFKNFSQGVVWFTDSINSIN